MRRFREALVRAARVPVPPELRRALAQLDVKLGRRRAIAAAGCGPALFDELVAPGGLAQRHVIERVAAAIASHAEVA